MKGPCWFGLLGALGFKQGIRVQSAKLNDVGPFADLSDALERMVKGHPTDQPDRRALSLELRQPLVPRPRNRQCPTAVVGAIAYPSAAVFGRLPAAHQLPQVGLRRAAEIGETGAGAPKEEPPRPRGPSRTALLPTANRRGARTMLTKKEAGLKRDS